MNDPIRRKAGDAQRPSREEAEEAVKTLIDWIGEDSTRDGLVDTPRRVVKSMEEIYSGYGMDPVVPLARTFSETENYEDFVLVRDVVFTSHCEHHMLPFTGHAHVAYFPTDSLVGLSKIARVIDIFARRMQTQEKLTRQIANCLEETLKTHGIAVALEAQHSCMALRGIRTVGSTTITSSFTGKFQEKAEKQQFLRLIARKQSL